MKVIFYLSLLFLALNLNAQEIDRSKVSNRLLIEIKDNPTDFHRVSILLTSQVDIKALDRSLSERKVNLQERAYEVITTLQNHAAASQTKVIKLLQDGTTAEKDNIRSFWISNLVFASAKWQKVAELSQLPEVAWLDLNGLLEQDQVEKIDAADVPMLVEPDGIEPGLRAINAPAMWEMGYTGYGCLAFVSDTGVDPTHSSISSKWRGCYAPAKESWFQFQSSNKNPFDCGSHGTHVLGTMVGLDRAASDTIGVAFNSLWVGAPILCGLATEDNVAAFEWALDPDEDPSTITDMPDVINNSWFDPNIQDECNNVYNNVLDALDAAGVAVIFSAGNAGPDPSTITPPHNINTDQLNSFTVGAVNANNSSLAIADFSSRGPALCNNEDLATLIKPEVSAPGVFVRSCVPGNEYDFFSGTSMAAPHVSGSILLLKEAFPSLTGRQLKKALYDTARDLGVAGEDNVFGRGMIDVLAAFNYLKEAGHIPVDPKVENDLLLVDLEVNEIECDREVTATLVFENAGQAPIQSFDVVYQIDGFSPVSKTGKWEGELMPGERVSIALSALEVIIPGNVTLAVNATLPNGETDDRPLNNILKKRVSVSKKSSVNVFTAQGLDISLCQNTPVVLQTDYEGEGTVEWYDARVGGNLLGTGKSFVTEPLGSSKTFYANVFENKKLGIKEITEGEILWEDPDFDPGLYFDVFGDVFLKSVKINAPEKGARFVSLLDESGTKITEKPLLIKDVGVQRVDLNMEIPPGENYQLVLSEGKPLLSVDEEVDFPYTEDEDGLVEILNSNHPVFKKKHYYYFFDWEITYDEICGRKSVFVEVNPDAVAPLADFNSTLVVVDSDTSGLVQFEDQSEGAVQWIWDFGDGNTSNEQNPQHEFTEVGSYLVSLTIVSDEGCANVKTALIEVEQVAETTSTAEQIALTNAIQLFPNPTQGRIQLSLNLPTGQAGLTKVGNINIQLLDVLGREVELMQQSESQQIKKEFDLSNYAEGIYFIRFDVDGVQVLKKVLIVK